MLSYKLLLLGITFYLLHEVRGNSIAFVIDNTSSMKQKIDEVKQVITNITDIYSKSMFINQYVIVKFNDPELLTDYKIVDERYLFDVELSSVDASGLNIDCPEPTLFGVLQALFHSEPKSHIYVFTDASPKDYYRLREVIKMCQKGENQITFIVTGHCLTDPEELRVYRTIARNCSGNVLVVTKDELDQIPAYIRETIDNNTKVLMKTKIPANEPADVVFRIANQTRHIIISASGSNVHIHTPDQPQKKIVWTDNFKAIKLLTPALGEHNVTISGESIDVSVDIIAVEFNYTTYDNVTQEPTTEAIDSTSRQSAEAFKPPSVEISEGIIVEVPFGGEFLFTCKVMANPKPDIVWKDENGTILPSTLFSLFYPNVHVSFLNMSDIIENGFYACNASNIIGYDTKYIEVRVKNKPWIMYTNNEGVNSENDFDLAKSFKQEIITVEQTTNTGIQDGYPPVPMDILIQTVDWCEIEELHCLVSAKPQAKYDWLCNGIPVNGSKERLDITNTGNYTCRATNIHGSIQFNFEVVATNCCIIHISNSVNHRTPFIVNENLASFESKGKGILATLPSNKKLILTCHNPFQKTSPFCRNNITVTCDHEYVFEIEGLRYKLDDISCDKEVYPVIETVELGIENKLIKVGFISEAEFVEIYRVFISTTKGGSVMARYNATMNRKHNFADLHWYDHPKISKEDFPGLYNCTNSSSCCYAKKQLVSASDVAYGGAQTSTFINNLNSVPYWRTCDGSPNTTLEYFEKILVNNGFISLQTVSGASEYIAINGEYVPRYLWKVIKVVDVPHTSYVAYVYVNVEDAESYPLGCRNFLFDLVPYELEERIYICDLDVFAKSFDVPLSIFYDF